MSQILGKVFAVAWGAAFVVGLAMTLVGGGIAQTQYYPEARLWWNVFEVGKSLFTGAAAVAAVGGAVVVVACVWCAVTGVEPQP